MTEVATRPDAALPAEAGPSALAPLVAEAGMPMGLRVMLDERLLDAAERMASRVANSLLAPAHLRGDVDTCFTVVMDALNSGLDPMFVARNTFPIATYDRDKQRMVTTGIGAQAALVRAKMEASRYFAWIRLEYEGDWSKVQGRWKMEKNDRGKEVMKAAYAKADEAGLAVVITAQRRDRRDPDVFRLEMIQCQPRNSTLWATDPKTQATYVITRRYCTIYAPHILGGMRYDADDVDPADLARDVSPEPRRPAGPAAQTARRAPEEAIELVDRYGAVFALEPGAVAGWIAEQVKEATDPELQELLGANEDREDVRDAVMAEAERRAAAQRAADPDPLKILGKPPAEAVQALKGAVEQAETKAEATSLFWKYKDALSKNGAKKAMDAIEGWLLSWKEPGEAEDDQPELIR